MATRVVVVPSRRRGRSSGGGTMLGRAAGVALGLFLAIHVFGGHHPHLNLTVPAQAHAAAARLPSAGRSAQVSRVVAFAEQQLGKPYAYGAPRWAAGAQPPGSFDCSSLTQWAWAASGVLIPGTSETQWAALPHIGRSQLQAGDLIFETGSPVDAPPGHVYLYLGRGRGLEAYGSGYPVRIISVRWSDASGYARVT